MREPRRRRWPRRRGSRGRRWPRWTSSNPPPSSLSGAVLHKRSFTSGPPRAVLHKQSSTSSHPRALLHKQSSMSSPPQAVLRKQSSAISPPQAVLQEQSSMSSPLQAVLHKHSPPSRSEAVNFYQVGEVEKMYEMKPSHRLDEPKKMLSSIQDSQRPGLSTLVPLYSYRAKFCVEEQAQEHEKLVHNNYFVFLLTDLKQDTYIIESALSCTIRMTLNIR